MQDPIERRTITAQLASRIEAEIHAGTWTTALPGKRTLAQRFGVNVKTCAAALDLLEKQGWLQAAGSGRRREILKRPGKQEKSLDPNKRLLVIHSSGGIANFEDLHLLQSLSGIWERLHGQATWIQTDFGHGKSPDAALDRLIATHSADALLLYMPSLPWSKAALIRIPTYQTGGPCEIDALFSLGACDLEVEIERIVDHFVSLGHTRILIPTDGFGDSMRQSIISGFQAAAKKKPACGTWEDYVPDFPERVPEVWNRYWSRSFATIRPTAVMVFDDTHLLSLYGYCFKTGIRIPEDLSVISLNYESRFEWLSPRPTMMRYPIHAALAHFQQWVDHGLKPIGPKFFKLEMADGESVARCHETLLAESTGKQLR